MGEFYVIASDKSDAARRYLKTSLIRVGLFPHLNKDYIL